MEIGRPIALPVNTHFFNIEFLPTKTENWTAVCHGKINHFTSEFYLRAIDIRDDDERER